MNLVEIYFFPFYNLVLHSKNILNWFTPDIPQTQTFKLCKKVHCSAAAFVLCICYCYFAYLNGNP